MSTIFQMAICARNESAYQGTWFRTGPGAAKDLDQSKEKDSLRASMRLPAEGREAKAIIGRARTSTAVIESIESENQRMAPPALYDLTELQRHANRLFGFSAQKTLDVAQALYERHKLISYPRTDSRHLSRDVAVSFGPSRPTNQSPPPPDPAAGAGGTPTPR